MMAQQLQQHGEDDDITLSSSRGIDVDFNNNGDERGGKAARLPRWTRQEILVLIQGKRVAENRVKRGRSGIISEEVQSQGQGQGQGQGHGVEPKWSIVSSYCKRHGVNRGPVQCRKRWSNLAGDFKKIKEWDSHIEDESESFWVMRNDVRRERKLPGFFDREVFDILNSNQTTTTTTTTTTTNNPQLPPQKEEQSERVVFDSGRSAVIEDGLFSDFDHNSAHNHHQQQQQQEAQTLRSTENKEADHQPQVEVHVVSPIPAPTPISEKQYQPMSSEAASLGTNQGKQQVERGTTSSEERKRRRILGEEEDEGQDELIQVLERNGRILSSQLDAYNINLKLDREERKDHATSLVVVLNKLADALGKIADKL